MEDVRPFQFLTIGFDDGERPLKTYPIFKANYLLMIYPNMVFEQRLWEWIWLGRSPILHLRIIPANIPRSFDGTISQCEMPNPCIARSDFAEQNMPPMAVTGRNDFVMFLAYIERFEPPPSYAGGSDERIINETGQSGFHFVDESPPALPRVYWNLRRASRWPGGERLILNLVQRCVNLRRCRPGGVTGGVEAPIKGS